MKVKTKQETLRRNAKIRKRIKTLKLNLAGILSWTIRAL